MCVVIYICIHINICIYTVGRLEGESPRAHDAKLEVLPRPREKELLLWNARDHKQVIQRVVALSLYTNTCPFQARRKRASPVERKRI